MDVLRLGLRRVCACVVVALATGATVAAGVASAAPPTLDRTSVTGDVASWLGCVDGRLSYAGSGEARGDDYPGTFVASARATLSPFSFPMGSGAPLDAFGAQISIASGTRRVEATLSLATSGGTEGQCTASESGPTSRVAGAFAYVATITAPDGVYRDEGVATFEITGGQSTGGDSGDVRASFDSALTEPGLTGPDRDGDGVPDGVDNCPDVANTDQANGDGDGAGNVCDLDAPPPSSGSGGAGPGGTTTSTSATTTSATSGSGARRTRIRPRRLVLNGVAWNSRPNRVNVDVWGGVRLRPGMRRDTMCGSSQGKVRFVVSLRGRTVGKGVTRVQRDCNFKKVVAAVTRGRRLTVKATFEGNRRLARATTTIRLTARR